MKKQKERGMADIIDLDFYRKFRVVLPIRPSTLVKNKKNGSTRVVAKRYRRKRLKADVEPKTTLTKE
jgi:hypothetical protein